MNKNIILVIILSMGISAFANNTIINLCGIEMEFHQAQEVSAGVNVTVVLNQIKQTGSIANVCLHEGDLVVTMSKPGSKTGEALIFKVKN